MTTIVLHTGVYIYAIPLSFVDESAFLLSANANTTSDIGTDPTLHIQSNVTVVANTVATVAGVTIGMAWPNSGKWVVIDDVGYLRVTSNVAQGAAYGFYANDWSPNFANDGHLEVTARGLAEGVYSASYDGITFENTGTFKVTATEGQAVGVADYNGVYFRNTGLLDVYGRDGAQGLYAGDGSRFYNSGTIRVADSNPGFDSVAVTSTSANDRQFVNDGWIQGDVAVSYHPGWTFGGPQHVVNNGTLVGKVYLDNAKISLLNTGMIQGDVTLGDEADIYDGHAGHLVGAMHAGQGDDSLVGGADAETFSGDAGNDTISGGAGDDLIEGGRDSDHLDGGAGLDTVTYALGTAALNLDLQAGTASSSGVDTLSNFERVVGSAFADTISGSTGGDTLSGGAGDDQILGREGNDSIDGGSGANYLRGDEGNDLLQGGADFDDINGNMGNDTAHGGASDDWVVGGKDNDLLFGDDGGDVVYGNIGNDTCDGGTGADLIRGGQDNDVLTGGAGDDWLSGDRGSDTITGGSGADIFHTFGEAGADWVTDFNLAQGDRVMLDPGTAYIVAQSGPDVVINMVGLGYMVLQNVQLSELHGDWIFGN
ncbi:MAG: calcium-binding protein [Phenylobacterium sp.]